MARVLVVKAHPMTGETSKSMKVLDTFLEGYKKNNTEDEIVLLDLYAEDFPEVDLDIMNGWAELGAGKAFTDLTAAQQAKITRFNEATDQFVEMDKIIIANGLWNLNVPTRLKAWVDAINVAGKTFRYTAEGPEPVAPGKKVMHIQAAGGVYAGQDFATQYIKGIMSFLGAASVENILIEGADHQPERTEEIVAEAIAQAEAFSATF